MGIGIEVDTTDTAMETDTEQRQVGRRQTRRRRRGRIVTERDIGIKTGTETGKAIAVAHDC